MKKGIKVQLLCCGVNINPKVTGTEVPKRQHSITEGVEGFLAAWCLFTALVLNKEATGTKNNNHKSFRECIKSELSLLLLLAKNFWWKV